MAVEEEEFGLRPLHPNDSFASMKSGDARYSPLTLFARKKAKPYEQASLARTYVIEDRHRSRIAGFVTLVCSEVVSRENLVEDDDLVFPYDHYPAVKIARLLVDERYRNGSRLGLGRILVEFAIGLARSEICPAVGCRFVVVDAKSESVNFYRKCGFTSVDTQANRTRAAPVMFIDLHKTANA